ncbi:hypothetical protein Mal15_66190 [Stieleria maiorica]|uniref:Uncharacterized protein n=1 Tax=Stieleria maiorica TaxID=2795974 RepID=A0A5B9MTY3_9BACT|nr:hypothetical protein [Stieleria maiorica]QEG02498.1 hypothetical protein Mal15_66190 [Stieleria maiorica]
MIVNTNRRLTLLFVGVLLVVGAIESPVAQAASLPGVMSGTTVARAIMKYFGKEGAEEATEYLARQGGREIAERVGAAAVREGGQEAAEQVSRLAGKYGPEALAALDNAPELAPLLAALDELPESQVRAALARLSAGTAGRELAQTVSRVGASALRSELKHPGVGGMLARTLGDDGAELATKLTGDQAIAVGRHADDLAALPSAPRQGVLALLRNDTERMVAFMGRFAADNPGKTLFTAATTTIILAESERILGGDEIVFDADGNPIVVSKAGIAGRTMKAGGEALAHVSVNYLQPLLLTAIAFVVTFATLFMLLKLWHAHQREKLLIEGMLREPETIEGSVVEKKAE